MPLLSRLFLLVAIALLPAIAIQTYNEIDLRRSRQVDVQEQALALAKLVVLVTGHADLVEGRGLDLPRLAKPFPQKDPAAALAAVVRHACDANTAVELKPH